MEKDPFALIERGYELERVSPWSSAYHFLEASNILRSNAKEYHESISTLDYKQRKVAALYEDQGNAYFQKARRVLLEAMHKESQSDENSLEKIPSRVQVVNLLHGEIQKDDDDDNLNLNTNTNQIFEPFMASLDEEETKKRRLLFELFISKEIQEENQADKELSLEERLAMLNSSIPKPKSDEQRLREIHSSLSGLGIPLPTTSREDTRQILFGDNDVSEQDQLEQIMHMAQDEVLLDNHNGGDSENDTKNIMQILKNASIRINLDPDSYNASSNNSATQTECSQGRENDTDAEILFWKNLQIDEQQPMSKMEEIQQYLATAQRLLLQTSICLEEMEEQGITFDDDHNGGHDNGGSTTDLALEMTIQDSDTRTGDHGDEAKDQKVTSQNNDVLPSAVDEINPELDAEPPITDDDANTVERDQYAKVDQDEILAMNIASLEEQAVVPDESKSAPANHAAEMGTGGLQEAQDLIAKVMSMWPSNSLPISEDENTNI